MFLQKKQFSSSNSNTKFDKKLNRLQTQFLRDADFNYLMTLKSMDMMYFSKYSTRELCMKIYHSLSIERPWIGISDKFKHTVWEMLESDSNGNFLVKKSTTFDKVKVSKSLKLSVADDYSEYWVVVCVNNTFKVNEIQLA